MRRIAAALLLVALMGVAAGCQSSKKGEDLSGEIYPPPVPQQQSAASDARLAELQTSLTELLERIDVLNDRMSRLETANAALTASAPKNPVFMWSLTPLRPHKRATPPASQAVQPHENLRPAT